MKQLSKMIVISLSLLTMGLVGCDQQGRITSEGVGTVTGGVLGGVLGSQVRGSGRTAATIGGVLLGGYLGGAVGRRMDEADRRRLAHSLEYSRTNHASRWSDSDRDFVVVPVSTYHDRRGRTCRRFRTTVIIDGRRQQAMGRACRVGRGQWQIVQ